MQLLHYALLGTEFKQNGSERAHNRGRGIQKLNSEENDVNSFLTGQNKMNSENGDFFLLIKASMLKD